MTELALGSGLAARSTTLGTGSLAWCDVFATQPGQGNPTVVVELPSWPAPERLARLSTLLAAYEVTFAVASRSGIELRWFSGMHEVPLCGHGALAAAQLLGAGLDPGFTEVRNLPGKLWLTRGPSGFGIALAPLALRPTSLPRKVPGLARHRAFDAGRDYLLVLESEAELLALRSEAVASAELDKVGLLVTRGFEEAAR